MSERQLKARIAGLDSRLRIAADPTLLAMVVVVVGFSAVLLAGTLTTSPLLLKIGFDPTFLRLGGLSIGWHGFFTAVAVLVAVWLGLRRAEAMGLVGPAVGSVAIGAVAGGLVGARLFYLFDHPSQLTRPADLLAIWRGGIAVYGSFLGGIVGGLIAARGSGLPVWRGLDAGAPAMLIGQMIGRLGCLSNGDAWGKPTGGSWGIMYLNANDLLPRQLLGVPTHPYPIYEIAAVALLLGLLWMGRKRLRAPGEIFLVAAVGYAVIRFGLTFFRQESVILWGLQEAQLVALGTGIVAIALLFARKAKREISAESSDPVV